MYSLIVLNSTEKNRFNCVLWAREKKPNLPFGLWTIYDKIKIVNSCTPEIGSVAVMNCGLPWGHLGIVKDFQNGIIIINEANFRTGKITERSGTSADLKILGYFI